MTNLQEVWQVEVSGQIYEANLEELTQWIAEGALQPQDRVRRSNLRWLEAGKIPLLYGFFNAKEVGVAPPVLTTIVDASQTEVNVQSQTENFAVAQIFETAKSQSVSLPVLTEKTVNLFQPEIHTLPAIPVPPAAQYKVPVNSNYCVNHPEELPQYACEACANQFCKACPKSYGGAVRICPLCGAMCKLIAEIQSKQNKTVQYQADLSKGFGLVDFAKALAYPFKFRFSLVSGAILYMFFSLGQSAAGLGGMYLVAAAIFCAMMANALVFGCLANTVDNMSQGKLEENFMPGFDDFNLWDDVAHPFFLSIATYISSFGLLAALMLGMIWYTWHTVTVQPTNSDQAQISEIKELVNSAPKQPRFENGQIIVQEGDLTPEQREALQQGETQKMQELIQQQRTAQLESGVGKSPETQEKEKQQMLQNLLKVGLPFIVLGFLASLWGLFYFPAACAVAGYTRSLQATLNPLVGLDTIRRMGFDYVKILGMCFLMAVVSGGITLVLSAVFAPFDLPGMGNLPAKALGSLFAFYISIVFAVTLGYALYKNSDKLKLYR